MPVILLLKDFLDMNMANPIIILIWNCRGNAGEDFRVALKDLIATHKPKVIVLTETRTGAKQLIELCPNLDILTRPGWTLKVYLEKCMCCGILGISNWKHSPKLSRNYTSLPK